MYRKYFFNNMFVSHIALICLCDSCKIGENLASFNKTNKALTISYKGVVPITNRKLQILQNI